MERGVNAIEINSKANKKWIEEIVKVKEKNNLILTFWSDCHSIWNIDDKHESYWNLNTNLKEDFIFKESLKFRDKIES